MIYPAQRLLSFAAAPAVLSGIALGVGAATAYALAAWAVLIGLAVLDARQLQARPKLGLGCQLPRFVREGTECTLEYSVSGLAPAAQVRLLAELPPDLGGDRVLSWRSEGARGTPPSGAYVERRSIATTPTRRGLRALGPWYVFDASPLGCWQRRSADDSQQVLAVLSRNTLPSRGAWSARRSRRELGLKPRRPRGEGTDFESLREYARDDERRKIDWRASARRDHLVVRDHHVEQSHTVLVAVDCGRLMGTQVAGQTKLDHALSAAMSLVRASTGSGDRVGFAAFDRELRAWVSPRPPRQALGAILQATLPLEPRSQEPSYRILSEALRSRQKKRALLVVLTDFVEGGASVELEAHLAALARRHLVLLVGLRDRLLAELSDPQPELSEAGVYRRLVLQDLDVARHTTLTRISRTGVQTLDLDPSSITLPLLDRYWAVRAAGLL